MVSASQSLFRSALLDEQYDRINTKHPHSLFYVPFDILRIPQTWLGLTVDKLIDPMRCRSSQSSIGRASILNNVSYAREIGSGQQCSV